MTTLEEQIERIVAETAFSGVVRVDGRGGVLARAYGLAHRGQGIANTVDTRFALASGVKGMTALVVVSLIDEGRLSMATTARSVLGDDLPLIGDDVTVQHLLAHRSGIGDFVDEDAGGDITDYVLPGSVHELATTEAFLRVLDGYPAKHAAGERFTYCNGGYVVLALIAERSSGVPFADLVSQRVCAPASLLATEFLRSDEPAGDVALGYLATSGLRTNIFHLPVLGSGDGGIYSTVADLRTFWTALFAGRIVPAGRVAEMVRPRSDVPSESKRYGLGFWLQASGPAVLLEGGDAGVSFRSAHDPTTDLTYTVISNTSDGAWPLVRHLDATLLS